MIIGVDLDEVCAEYYAGMRDWLALTTNLTPEQALERYPEPESYDMKGWMANREEFIKTHTEAVAKGLYKNLKVIKGASETLWKLNNEGHHIRVITSRFVAHGQNGTVIAQTAKWLDKNKIPYRDLMFVRNKPDVYADVYIDDAPENIHAFNSHKRNVIIFDRLYNRDIEGLRATNWNEVYSLVKEFESSSR